jgi:hypothetical protein
VVLYGDGPGDFFPARNPEWNTATKLLDALHRQGLPVIVIPHVMRPALEHPLWDLVDNELQTVAEVYSWQNQSKVLGGNKTLFELDWGDAWSVREAWRRGHIVGLIGSSDNHLGTPGYHRFAALTEHQDGGYAVTLAPANTRSDVFDALRRRRTYATTGIRALLSMEVAGRPIGSVVEDAEGPPQVHGYVAGTAPIAALRLFRADRKRGFRDLKPHDLDDRPEVFRFEFIDSGWKRDSLYYVRAEQEDGEMIWSSPVWVLRAGHTLQSFRLPPSPGYVDGVVPPAAPGH